MTWQIIALWFLGAIPSVVLSEISPDGKGFAMKLTAIIIFWPVISFYAFLKGILGAFS